jgi:curli production assembly/transport component CsgE
MSRSLKPLTLMFALSLMGASLVHAQQKPDLEGDTKKPSSVEDVPEYGGVVIDQTLTGLGRFFYVKFSEGWSTQSDVESYVLSIKERPSQRGGTEIFVSSNEQVVFRTALPRSYPAVVSVSEMAVERVHQSVVDLNLQSLLFNDPDLAKAAF